MAEMTLEEKRKYFAENYTNPKWLHNGLNVHAKYNGWMVPCIVVRAAGDSAICKSNHKDYNFEMLFDIGELYVNRKNPVAH